MDSLVIDNKEYISAKRAAREHAYTMDYVGQLIRGGKLLGKKVGRAWYVENDSLMAYVRSLAGKEMKGISSVQVRPVEISHVGMPVMQDVHVPVQQLSAHQSTPVQTQNTAEEVVAEEAVPTQVPVSIQPSLKKEKEETQTSGASPTNYTMLNYVRDEGEVLPELDVKPVREKEVESEEISEIRINRIQNSIPVTARKVSAPTRLAHISVAAKSDWSRDEAQANSADSGVNFLDRYADHHPAKRSSILPALMAGVFALAIFGLAGFSLFFTRTMDYEASTSSITTGFTYSDLGN